MKALILMFSLFLSLESHAQTPTPDTPVCDDSWSKVPCRIPESESAEMLVDMLIGNPKGYALIRKKTEAQRKQLSDGFLMEEIRITILKQEKQPITGSHLKLTTTTTRYEVLLNDCRGTDACSGKYLLTMDEVTESDGYTYGSKYVNSIGKTEIHTFKKD